MLTSSARLLIEYDGSPHYYDRRQEGAISLFQGRQRNSLWGWTGKGAISVSQFVHGGRSLIFHRDPGRRLTTNHPQLILARCCAVGWLLVVLNATLNFILTIRSFRCWSCWRIDQFQTIDST